MIVTNITGGYNDSLSIINNCTDNENNSDTIEPAKLLTIP